MRKANLVIAWIILALGVAILAKTLAAGTGIAFSTGVVFGGALIVVGVARILMHRPRSKKPD